MKQWLHVEQYGELSRTVVLFMHLVFESFGNFSGPESCFLFVVFAFKIKLKYQ